MTQVKLFYSIERSNLEVRVNQFLQENANSIKVIDIKHTTAAITNAAEIEWTAMIIYETL
jgi:hypothetical protein